jgi:hypothetical protein
MIFISFLSRLKYKDYLVNFTIKIIKNAILHSEISLNYKIFYLFLIYFKLNYLSIKNMNTWKIYN